MRTWHCAAALGLIALGFGVSRADTPPAGFDPLRSKVEVTPKPPAGFDPLRSKVDITPMPSQALKPYLFVAGVSARREGANIRVEGGIKSLGGIFKVAPTLNGQWILHRQVGNSWQIVKTGQLSVRDKEQVTIANTISNGPAATRFKLEVRTHGSNHVTSKQVVAPAQVFVVQYRLTEWKVQHGRISDNQIIRAKIHAERFYKPIQAMGFQVSVKYTRQVRLFDDWYEWDVTYRCVNWEQRSFDSSADAANFITTLPPFTERRLVLK